MAGESAVQTKRRLPYLDFLRCFAIVMVIGLHVISPYLAQTALYGSRSWQLYILANELGRAGVPLFLMISGYLMLRDPRTEDIAGFYRKRLIRLLPPLMVWNLVYYLRNAGGEVSVKGYVSGLLYQGSGYHMWFVYMLLGIYLLAPFLRKLVNACESWELLVLLGVIVFPGTLRTMLNSILPLLFYLFDPLVENYAGYFLLGYLLGTARLEKKAVWAIELGGVIGFILGVWGNFATASAEEIPLPSNMGYGINHYLVAAALFVLCRKLFERFQAETDRAAGVLGALSNVVFGVYWLHVLILEEVEVRLNPALTPVVFTSLESALTVLISFAVMLICGRIPVLRRVLM